VTRDRHQGLLACLPLCQFGNAGVAQIVEANA